MKPNAERRLKCKTRWGLFLLQKWRKNAYEQYRFSYYPFRGNYY